MATPRPAPQMTSSGLWAPTYTRPKITIPAMAHGSSFQRPGRYGETMAASAAASTAWPETKLSPAADTSPRGSMSLPIDVPGRSRCSTRLDHALEHQLEHGGRQRGRRQAGSDAARARPTATIGPTTSAPTCWNGQSTG